MTIICLLLLTLQATHLSAEVFDFTTSEYQPLDGKNGKAIGDLTFSAIPGKKSITWNNGSGLGIKNNAISHRRQKLTISFANLVDIAEINYG